MRPEGGCPCAHDRRWGYARLTSDVSAVTSAGGMLSERPTPHVAANCNVAPTAPLPIVRYDAKDHWHSYTLNPQSVVSRR
jgi:hypothetical protein